MAEYDGEIRIKTTVDTSGIKNEINSQKSSYQELSKERERLIKKQIQLEKEYANIVSQQSSLALQLESQENRILKILDRREAVQDAIAANGGAATDRQIEKLHQYEMDLELAEKKEALLKSRIEEKNVALQKASENLQNNSSKLERNSTLLDKVKNGMQKYVDSLGPIKDKLSSPFESAGKSIGRFGNRILNLAKSAFIFNIISAGFREMAKASSALIKSDDSLSRSLQEIKANLLTAFAPIYNAVLPALRELGKFLSWASLQLATFVSALFGKTLSQSQKTAQQMSRVINSSTKKQKKGLKSVSKEAKKTADVLASFDKIEVLNIDKGSQKPENESEKVPVDVAVESVGINEDAFKPVESSVSSFWNEIAERFKAPFQDIDLSNITNAFDNLKNTLSNFHIGEGLWWFYENVLAPFAKWTISEAIPSFLNVFNASLKVIQPIADQVGKDLKFIYDKFLKPAAEWVGSKIVEFLNNCATALENLADWLNNGENKLALEFISAFLIGISSAAVAAGISKVAFALSKKLLVAILQTWGALFTNPWTLVIIGIGIIIGLIIVLVKHWDDIKKFFSDVWDGFINLINDIKDKAIEFGKKVGDWVKSIGESISKKWNEIWDGAVNGIKEFGNKCIRFLNSITGGIRKFSNGIVDGINSLIDKLNGFGFKMPDWLGGWEFKMHVPKIPRVPESFLHIPELAQGAVLDGSSPFLAWLNDQPKGQTNIETPLNTMVEAFNKAIDNRGMNNNVVIQASGDISQLISYLNFELKKENSRIGDNMISGSVYV